MGILDRAVLGVFSIEAVPQHSLLSRVVWQRPQSFCQALAVYSRIVQRDHAEGAARRQAILVGAPEDDGFFPPPRHGPSENSYQKGQRRRDGDKPEDDGDVPLGHAVQK